MIGSLFFIDTKLFPLTVCRICVKGRQGTGRKTVKAKEAAKIFDLHPTKSADSRTTHQSVNMNVSFPDGYMLYFMPPG